MRVKLCIAAAGVAASLAAEAKTVAIAEIGIRSEKNLSVFEAAVKEAGHEVKKITGGRDLLEKPEAYEGADVIVLTGGWNDIGFPSRETARQLVSFAARGGGVFLGAFRSGAVRTRGYETFPEIAAAYNRVNSPWLWGFGDSPIAKAFGDGPVLFGGFDHMVLRVGPKGKVFVKSGDDNVGAFGDFGLGRVVVFGAFVSTPEDDANVVLKRGIFKSVVEYLAGGSVASKDAADKAEKEALAAFDRRMFILDWTFYQRGEGMIVGKIPLLRDIAVVPVEGKAMLLEFFARELGEGKKGEGRSKKEEGRSKMEFVDLALECGELAKKVREVSNAIRESADSHCEEVKRTFKPGDEAALKAEFAAIAAKAPLAEADALLEMARVAIRAQRKAERAAGHAEDVKSLPSLVSRLSSPVAATRLDAAVELGRIGEATPEVIAALVTALDDVDDRVRVQAAISLGWMQSKDAVPALIAKAHQNDDMPLKRRALQVLGQIGDDAAIPELMAALDSIDRYSVENAILSLGHLKAKEAVPKLVEIASDESEPYYKDDKRHRYKIVWNLPVMNRRASAITALGYIGDKAAIPALEEIVKKNKPQFFDDNRILYSVGASLNRFAKEAIAQIEAGGRAEKGVCQHEKFSSKKNFYTITRENNTLAGRIGYMLQGSEIVGRGRESLLLPYLLDAGFTGIHGAWCEMNCGFSSQEVALKVVREMEDYGLSWICIAPTDNFAAMANLFKGEQEYTFSRIGDCAAYAGAWSEELWYEEKAHYEDGLGNGFKLPESEDPTVCKMGAPARAARVARLEQNGASLDESWRESVDWLHARRKGFAMTYSVSGGNIIAPINTPKAASRMDVIGPESYSNFEPYNAFMCARFRNGEARATMTEFYNMYTDSNAHDIRGCWQAAIYGKCQYPFGFNQCGPFPGAYDLWAWDANRWGCYKKVATHVRDNKELYAVSPLATEVAVLLSERSEASFRHDAVYRQYQMFPAIDQSGLAIWLALAQSHIPSDVVFIDGATEEKLAKYKVLFLVHAKILTEGEQALLRKWVANGGTLVCEGAVGLFDAKNLMRRCEYAISDLLGVNYVKTDFAPSKDLYGELHGKTNGKFVFPAKPDLDNFYMFGMFFWRDFKPTDSIALASEVGGKKEESRSVEYDAALGIDRVELDGAKVVQAFQDGYPALTVNDFGKGKVYFFTSICPSLGHVTSCWEMKPKKFDFWPGVRETYEKLAREGLAHAGTAQAVDLLNASKNLDMLVYSQNGGKRLVVHLLDNDVNNKEVSGVSLRINGDRPVKAVYSPGWNGERTDLPLSGRAVALGTFEVYDMVVVEFE